MRVVRIGTMERVRQRVMPGDSQRTTGTSGICIGWKGMPADRGLIAGHAVHPGTQNGKRERRLQFASIMEVALCQTDR